MSGRSALEARRDVVSSAESTPDLHAAALAVAERLAERIRRASQAERTALGPHLYDGAAGIALFFAACEASSGRGRWRAPALELLAPLRGRLSRMSERPAAAAGRPLAIGGFVGLGGVLYVFSWISRWLGEPALADEARALVALFTPERIAGDDRLDVTSGSAGAILALLAAEEVLEEGSDAAGFLAAATACGERLLAARRSTAGQPPAWPGAGGSPALTGYAHGAAGIGHALARLFARTGDTAFRDAALDGFAFERSLYRPSARTWLDPRRGRPLEQDAWCHGAPGVALGRLGALAAIDDDALGRDLDLALEITLSLPFSSRDHLCCGNLGRAEVLLAASRRPGAAAARRLKAARRLAERVVERAAAAGDYALERVDLPGARLTDPCLFRGAAGVGYALLHVDQPFALPSVVDLATPEVAA